MITGVLLTSLLALTSWRPLPPSRSFPHQPARGRCARGNFAVLLTIVAAAKPSEETMNHNMSLRQVSDLLNVRMHRIEYCLSNQIVPEPKLRIASKRVFTPAMSRPLSEALRRDAARRGGGAYGRSREPAQPGCLCAVKPICRIEPERSHIGLRRHGPLKGSPNILE